MTGVETIKRQTRVAYGWLVVGQWVAAVLAYCLYGCTLPVCDMNSAAAAAVCVLWHYTNAICLSLCLCQNVNVSKITYLALLYGTNCDQSA